MYLGGHLDFYNPSPGNWLETHLDRPTPLRDVLAQLGVLNGELLDLDTTVVSDQDEVKLFSAVGGG